MKNKTYWKPTKPKNKMYWKPTKTGKFMLAWIILTVLSIALVSTGIWANVEKIKVTKNSGQGHFDLALASSDVYSTVGFLKEYRDTIELNEMTLGTCGRVYKTPDRDMSARFKKLEGGISFLEGLGERYESSERLNTADIGLMTLAEEGGLRKYVENLDVGVWSYLSANYPGWLTIDWLRITGLIIGIVSLIAGTVGLIFMVADYDGFSLDEWFR